MVESLEKIALGLARDALAEQSVEVAEIRSRAGPVLAGAAAAAGLLARSAFNHSVRGNGRSILQSGAAVIGVGRRTLGVGVHCACARLAPFGVQR